MTDKLNGSSNDQKKANPGQENRSVDDRMTQLKDIFKLINTFPIKTMLLVSPLIGGFPVVGYFVYIGYLPNFDVMNFSFLAAQSLVAGSLIIVAFSCLFLSSFIASKSPVANSERKENSDGKGKMAAFLLIVLSHFPIFFLIYAVFSDSDSMKYLWWGLFALWLILFIVLSFYRFKLIRKAFQTEDSPETKITAEYSDQQKGNEQKKALLRMLWKNLQILISESYLCP